MRLLILVLILNSMLFSYKSNCQQIKIDHVICVVKDLDKSTSLYKKAGFKVKNGRLHKNGLINAHIKFNNHSSFELMSLRGKAGDAIAKNYEKLLKDGEGGVFLAITGINTNKMIQILSDKNIPHKVIRMKPWSYITFPDSSSLAHFFFIDYHINVIDKPEILIHKNKANKIKDVFVEGNQNVITFLKALGLKNHEETYDSERGTLTQFKTETGNIWVFLVTNSKKRPRIQSISFTK